jgi:exodeoxyribonuclease VII small subunit
VKKDLSFEEAFKQLEHILKLLEEGEPELEEAIKLYEEGMKLVHFCEEKLKNAKAKVEVILKDREGFKLETLEKAEEILKNAGK